MDYFKILNLSKEPFSNSPDPAFFSQSKRHVACLQKIELSLRLRRGLSVVIGDVGTGKTTLCRQLSRKFSSDVSMETHLMSDPYFSFPSEFLSTVAKMFGEYEPEEEISDWRLKEIIKNYLFRRGVEEGKTVILIIDEGQKLPDFCLEILREFLNYETNEYKLLQIVIFAQKEFERNLIIHQNFADRIDLYCSLKPLNFHETRAMIRFRLDRASEESNKIRPFFSYPALWVIYKATGGYPRKVINLCHRIILTLIIQSRSRIGWSTARFCAVTLFPERARQWQRTRIGVLIGVLAVAVSFALASQYGTMLSPWEREKKAPFFQVNRGPINVGLGHYQNSRTAQTHLTETLMPIYLEPTKTSVETASEQPIPSLLGQIAVNEDEWLAEMIRKVYGVFNQEYLKSVIQVNREIENPDLIAPGQVISFPAVPVKLGQSSLKFWWVVVARKERLEDAYQFLRTYSGNGPPMKMISYWNSQQGLRFVILYKDHFADEESARSSLKELPSALASGAKIFSGWDGDTIFFSSPMR